MKQLISVAGNAAGLLGILVCLIAGATRIAGGHWVLGFEAITMFIGGVGLMVAACLAKLHSLSAD